MWYQRRIIWKLCGKSANTLAIEQCVVHAPAYTTVRSEYYIYIFSVCDYNVLKAKTNTG